MKQYFPYTLQCIILWCITSILPNQHSIAQCTTNLSITVVDSKESSRIGYYEISVGDMYGFGDQQGNWTGIVPCDTILHIHVIYPSHDVIDIDVPISKRDTAIVLSMELTRLTLDDIEVLAHRQTIYTTNAHSVINKKDILSKAGLSLSDILSTVAGVNAIKTGSGIAKPMIHGMHSNRLLILNNGVRQEGQQWGMEHAPEIDPYAADQMTVIKGAEAVRYGSDAIGGVVLIEPEPVSHTKLIKGDAFLLLQSNGRGLSSGTKLHGNVTPIKGLQYATHGSAKMLGNQWTPQYYLGNTAMREYSGSLSLRYHRDHADYRLYYSDYASTVGILTSAHLGSLDDLAYALDRGRPPSDGSFTYDIASPRQQLRHRLLKADAHIHLNDYLHLYSIYAWQQNDRQEYDKRRGGLSAIPSLDLSIHTHTWDNYFTYFDGYHWMIQGGINLLFQDNKTASNTLTVPLIPDYVRYEYAGYGMAKYSKGNNQVEIGARVGHLNINALGYDQRGNLYGGVRNYINYAGTLGYSYKPNNIWSYNTNLGSAYRAPSMNELYSAGLHHGAAQMEYGDSTLHSEMSYKWIHAITFTPTSRFTLMLDVYGQYIQNFIYLQALGTYYASLRGVFPKFRYQQTDVIFYGADITATYIPASWLTVSSSHSVTIADKVHADDFLPWIPPYQNTNTATIKVPDYKVLRDQYITLKNQNVARQNRWSAQNDYAPPPPAYTLWHVSYHTDFMMGNIPLTFGIGVDNAFNTLYKDYLNRYRYYAHDSGRNFYLRLSHSF